MSFIHLTTFIAAPNDRVFDLSRNISLHKKAVGNGTEKIVQGTNSGIMNLDDILTWNMKFFFKQRRIKIKLARLQKPEFYVEEMVEGDLAMMKHEHYFKPIENGTIMIDQFHYEIKKGLLGNMINRFFLEKYIRNLLHLRNELVKKFAESNQWNQYLS